MLLWPRLQLLNAMVRINIHMYAGHKGGFLWVVFLLGLLVTYFLTVHFRLVGWVKPLAQFLMRDIPRFPDANSKSDSDEKKLLKWVSRGGGVIAELKAMMKLLDRIGTEVVDFMRPPLAVWQFGCLHAKLLQMNKRRRTAPELEFQRAGSTTVFVTRTKEWFAENLLSSLLLPLPLLLRIRTRI